MAYPLPLNTTMECIIYGTHCGQTVMTILHYQYTGSSAITDGAAALNAFITAIIPTTKLYDTYRGVMATNWTCQQITAQAIKPTRFVRVAQVPGLVAGAGPSDAYAPATALCITKRSDRANRSGYGTTHLPAVPNDWQDAGQISFGAVATYELLAAQLRATITPTSGQTWQPIVYHRTDPALSPFITSTLIQRSLRTERRRVLGRGI